MAEVRFTGPHAWSEHARHCLRGTFTCELGERRVINGVNDGSRQLWHVYQDEIWIGVIVTETLRHADRRELFIWCYQGRDSVTVVRAIGFLAGSQGVAEVGFFTPHHRAALRVFKRFSPHVSNEGAPGEKRFTFDVRSLA